MDMTPMPPENVPPVTKRHFIFRDITIGLIVLVILGIIFAFVIIPLATTDIDEGVGLWGDAPLISGAVQLAYKIKCEKAGGEIFELNEGGLVNHCGIGKAKDAYKTCTSSDACEIFCGLEGGFLTADAGQCVPYHQGWVGTKYEDVF